MPTPKTFAAVLVDVESLLDSVTLNAEQLPNLDGARTPLDAVLVELKGLATRRSNHKAEKQLLSQQIQNASQRARDLATNLRALLKGNLGSRSQKLTEFNVAPLSGKRKKKATDPLTAKPTPPFAPIPVSAPEAGAGAHGG